LSFPAPFQLAHEPAALVLVAAYFDADSAEARLTFDRPVNSEGYVAYSLSVKDGEFTGYEYDGVAAMDQTAPNKVAIGMDIYDTYGGGGVLLTASSATGIVAVDDGGTWAGATDLALPFP
jgi:hypothetical protein